jgi:SAM-dependent methyltransferase
MKRTLTLLAAVALGATAQINPTFGKPNPERWDRVYSGKPIFNTAPNAFLAEVVKGLKPGRALDIGMGQGRNAVYLAQLGWDVTGFDISEKGLEAARQSAKAAGVKIAAVRSTMEEFDYRAGRWDLVVGTYVGASWLDKAREGLTPGGLVVVEAFFLAPGAPAGFRANELPRIFMERGFRILRYEDVAGRPDWSSRDGQVVRLFAKKSE